jgi:hypothetical protein
MRVLRYVDFLIIASEEVKLWILKTYKPRNSEMRLKNVLAAAVTWVVIILTDKAIALKSTRVAVSGSI